MVEERKKNRTKKADKIKETKKELKRTMNNIDNRKIFTANRAMINVGPGKTRLVFFNDSPQKKLGDSEVISARSKSR